MSNDPRSLPPRAEVFELAVQNLDLPTLYGVELRSTGFRTAATIREMHVMSYPYIVVIRLRLFEGILYE